MNNITQPEEPANDEFDGTFESLKNRTAADVEQVAALLTNLATEVRAGDIGAFERWWIEGGTEEGDATVFKIRDLLMLRHTYRCASMKESTDV